MYNNLTVNTILPLTIAQNLTLSLQGCTSRLIWGSYSAFLQALAELKRSVVANNMSVKSTLSDVLTSSGTFLLKGPR
jgi:hypothetical protein